ncbi:MAG: hypothetical protein LC664_01815 [Flavobacteriales bacterium]|nr:hypothetical protein [Flavobacteriales bacterium]
MALHRITDEIEIPLTLEDTWDFFTNPRNLQKLTPDDMGFRHVYEPDRPRVYPGMYLVYKVAPIAGIPLTWITEITEVKPMERFVDDQIQGPFGRMYSFFNDNFVLKVWKSSPCLTYFTTNFCV